LYEDAILVYIGWTPIWRFLFARELVYMRINTSPNTWNVWTTENHKGRTIIFLEGGDENFFKTNNFFLCCCLCKQFFPAPPFCRQFFLYTCVQAVVSVGDDEDEDNNNKFFMVFVFFFSFYSKAHRLQYAPCLASLAFSILW